MLGAIIGDIVGSVYEFESDKKKDFELFTEESRLTDDSMMTIAVGCACAKADLSDEDDFKSWLFTICIRLAESFHLPDMATTFLDGLKAILWGHITALATALQCESRLWLGWQKVLKKLRNLLNGMQK